MMVLHVNAQDEQFLITPNEDDSIEFISQMIEDAYRSLFPTRPTLHVGSIKDSKGYFLPISLRVGNVLVNHDEIYIVPDEGMAKLDRRQDISRYLACWEHWQKLMIHALYDKRSELPGISTPEFTNALFPAISSLVSWSSDPEETIELIQVLQSVYTLDSAVSVKILGLLLSDDALQRHENVTTQAVALLDEIERSGVEIAADLIDLLLGVGKTIEFSTVRDQIHDLVVKLEHRDSILPSISGVQMNRVIYFLQSAKPSCQSHAIEQLETQASSALSWQTFTNEQNVVPELLQVYQNLESKTEHTSTCKSLIKIIVRAASYSSTCTVMEANQVEFLITVLLREEFDESCVLLLKHCVTEKTLELLCAVSIELWIKLLLRPHAMIKHVVAQALTFVVQVESERDENAKLLIKWANLILEEMYTDDQETLIHLVTLVADLSTTEACRARFIQLGAIPLLSMLANAHEIGIRRLATKTLATIATSSDDRRRLVVDALGEEPSGESSDKVMRIYTDMIYRS